MKLTYDWWLLAPVLIPAVGSVFLLLLDALLPRLGRVHWALTAILLLAGAAAAVPGALPSADNPRETLCLPTGVCLYSVDHVGVGLQLTALVSGAVIALLALPIRVPAERAAIQATLLLAATAGATGVVAARDLGSWLVLLELATLPAVALVALRARRSAVDGALSMLMTALVSFAITTMGVALWFAATGSALFTGNAVLNASRDADSRRILVLAVVFIIAGLAFKMSLAPFHAWTPEAFGGASVPIGGFLAVTSKAAALAALLVIFRGVTVLGTSALAAIGVLSAVSMTLGNVMALREKNALRFLAWSTVSQAGWVVLPLATVSSRAVLSAAAYLVVYAVATLVAFAVVTALAHADGRDHAIGLASYGGLLRRRPMLAVTLALALLTLMGLPPAVIGLVAKVAAIGPVAGGRLWVLAVIAALNAMLGVAVYLRWLRILFGARKDPDQADRLHPVHHALVIIGACALVVTSIAPHSLLQIVGR
ncbi:NADH-quinone oxidoreductase subunit N [Flexivirga oryzae]|uniref:NADH-quinone oxidoreductase subunit N n=1 Tax=Flexivirga oryzae TaxID=1794944 RepID=A0A839NEF2_9MICO|nr:proton-conducting transporter membrane subunit [Flexivirga oryzae]MBB2894703.1 NADH-quinone oxidoreductase subunit N [Flexivirga oryzae]